MSGRAREIRELLEASGIALKKRWGQNFLINGQARERLLRLLDPAPQDLVWEIGGGTGVLTEALLASCSRLVVFEIDHGLVRILEELLAPHAAGTVVSGDFCRSYEGALERFGPPDRIMGNLPYRSASRIIAAIVASGLEPRRMLFTVQRELGERMAARPSTKAYSSFSVLCQAGFNVRAEGDLGPGSFYPSPRVTSRIVTMEPRRGELGPADLRALQAVTRLLFATRRKTIRRSIRASGVPGALADAVRAGLTELGIGTDRRPEELTVEQFISLSRIVGPAVATLSSLRGEVGEAGSEDAALPEH